MSSNHGASDIYYYELGALVPFWASIIQAFSGMKKKMKTSHDALSKFPSLAST